MTAFDKTSIQTTQKSLFQASQLFRLSAFAQVSTVAVMGLFSTQAVLAQTETGANELAIPQSTFEIPTAQPAAAPVVPVTPAPAVPVTPAPAVPAPVPQVVEPVTPISIEPSVPSSLETTSVESEAVDYGTVFIQPDELPNATTLESLLDDSQSSEIPDVDVILPTDYSTGLIDTTDYSVGATMPDVVISERSSGCEFSVNAGTQITNAACRQVERLTGAIANRIQPTQAGVSTVNPINIPGIQISGATTAASRDYYNQAAKSVIELQLGEKFIFPLAMPAPLTSLFGWRIHPIFGARRFHSGTDVGAPLGTSVVATQSGRVTLSDYAGGYGLMVVLRHSNDTLESRYAHLSRLLVQVGEWVEQGEVIGLVGSTGNSTGPHLHFELRQLTDNGWVVLNPDSLLRQTLGTLVQALGNSLVALSDTAKLETSSAPDALDEEPLAIDGLPFRPAQPHAN